MKFSEVHSHAKTIGVTEGSEAFIIYFLHYITYKYIRTILGSSSAYVFT